MRLDIFRRALPEDEFVEVYATTPHGSHTFGITGVEENADGDCLIRLQPDLETQERAAREHERQTHLHNAQRVLSDLDRCPHGRHRGDVCSGVQGCDGPSKGNPHLPAPGEVVGYDLGGRPYVMPAGHLSCGNAESWRA